jgi:hypothetical protein
MNQNPAISDDPLPEGERVPPAQVHTDPHSLAAVASSELHDPDLHRVQDPALLAPDLQHAEPTPLADVSTALAQPPAHSPPSVVAVPSKNHALNTQMAQVGLTSSDQWQEHFQPRIQKLTEDIALVHVELDKLERKKSTK